METVATHSVSRALLRHSRWDAILIGLSLLHAMAMYLVPSIPVIAIGLWWNSNTISHNFIHLPFFRSNRWNRAYSIFLSMLLGFPQTLWRDRHLAHHGGHNTSLRFSTATALELGAVLSLWGFLLYGVPGFFVLVYLPGYALGLCLCFLHGYFEHAPEGTTSHYGFSTMFRSSMMDITSSIIAFRASTGSDFRITFARADGRAHGPRCFDGSNTSALNRWSGLLSSSLCSRSFFLEPMNVLCDIFCLRSQMSAA
jgi:hypothetical protein